MKYLSLLFFVFMVFCSGIIAQTAKTASLSTMFYNVENLFDTIDDPHKNDNDFLPQGKNTWTGARMYKKVNNLAAVITAAGRGSMPDLIGMAEIENEACLKYMLSRSMLSSVGYRYVHYESPDPRGIDCALLYNPKTTKIIRQAAFRIVFPASGHDGTRDLLYVVAKTQLADTIHVIVAHLPSRRGGKKKSDVKRLVVANRIKQIVDSVQKLCPAAGFVIMGDFNDRPDDESICSVLQVQYQLANPQKQQLYGLLQETNGEGSYKFQGRWQQIDHFFVNGLLLQSAYTCSAHIVRESFMLEPDNRNAGQTPFRTYSGPRYIGGYSDHLPIYLKIERR